MLEVKFPLYPGNVNLPMQTIKFLVSSFPVKNSSSKLSYAYAISKPRSLLPSLINERRDKEII